MSTHSVVDAKNHLSELIDQALNGQSVVITRHGYPVVELRAVHQAKGPVTSEDLEWLAAHRVGKAPIEDSGTLMSRIRDEGEK